jgi:non-ribosomal peptide synthetase component F
MSVSGLEIEPLEETHEVTRFDLSLSMREEGDELVGKLVYRTELFEPATVERMAGRLRSLLRSIVAEPDAPIDSLEFLTEEEREQMSAKQTSVEMSFAERRLGNRRRPLRVERGEG